MIPQDTTKEFRDKIDAWTAAGLKLDKRVTQKLDELEKFEYIDTRPPALPASLEDPEKAITDLALAFAVDERKSLYAPSYAELAKVKICNQLATQGIGLMDYSNAMEQLKPRFEAAAADYVAAVKTLPEDFGTNSLVAEGDVFDAYSRARAAAGQLVLFDNFVRATAPRGYGIQPQFRITTPQSTDDYREILIAEDEQDAAIRALNPVWFRAAQLGVPFEMNGPLKAYETRKAVAFEYKQP